MRASHNIEIIRTGLLDYGKALLLQHELHAKVVQDPTLDGFFVFTEHPSVITLGKRESLDQQNVAYPVVETDRGGLATAHEPGQLVIYPVLALTKLGLSPKSYVCLFEEALILLLKKLGIQGERKPALAGVWLKDKKIASIGIRVKQRVSLHGAALNVSNSLKTFQSIIPCGIYGCEMTSVNKETNQSYTPDDLIDDLSRLFLDELTAFHQRSCEK